MPRHGALPPRLYSRLLGSEWQVRFVRIGFDARFIQDQYHGIGRYAFELLTHVIRLGSEHTFVVLWNPGVENRRFDLRRLLDASNVEAIECRSPLYWPQSQVQMPITAWRARLDLLHVPYFATPLASPCPVVVTMHDLIFERFPSYMPSRWARTYYRLWTWAALRRATAVLTVSEATRADLSRYYRLSPEEIHVTPLAAGSLYRPATAEQRADVRRRYGLPPAYVLVVGARRPHKNVETVVRAFHRIRDRIPHTLVMVGEADRRFRDPVPGLIQQLGLDDRVLELPRVPEYDLPLVYSAADVLACPSIIEGFGLPVLEAMACELPVVTSRCSSLAEVGGDAAILIDPTDDKQLAAALFKIAGDAGFRADLKARGAVRARMFSWEHTARRTLEAYRHASTSSAAFAGVGHHADK